MGGRKVVLATFGSYGDLHPFMALALELQALGLQPVIATSAAYRDKIEAEGVAFHAVRPSPEQLARDTGLSLADYAVEVARSSVSYIMDSAVLPYLAEAVEDLTAAIADAELVALSSFSIAGMMAAEALGKPTVCVPLSPIVLLSAEDPPVLEQLPILPLLRRAFGPLAARRAVKRASGRTAATPRRRTRQALSGWSPKIGQTSCGVPARRACAVVPIPP